MRQLGDGRPRRGAAPLNRNGHTMELTMTFHEHRSKAVQDYAPLAAERGRLLLVARRDSQGMPHACGSPAR